MLCRCPRRISRIASSKLCSNAKFDPSWSRGYAATVQLAATEDRTRNIGIIAHIDAGKTTTTERMLYYSGFTKRIGDVDEGSTITDFLPAERARGITIQSAAITFSWPPSPAGNQSSTQTVPPGTPRSSIPHTINLIDTPGHADFTFEVLRSLRVLDGAVCILDSVAGVEAQTEKVWAQASAYQIPKIIFVNKLDRDGASFARTVREVGAKLRVWPAVCVIPWWDTEGALKGVGDVVGLRGLAYPPGGDGKSIQLFESSQLREEDANFAKELEKARIALVEMLAEFDDQMVEQFLESNEDHLAVSPQDIRTSLRRCTLLSPQQVVPICAGASFRNVGVQPLLDAVVDLLPSHIERPDPEISLSASKARGTLAAFLNGKVGQASPAVKPQGKAVAKKQNNTSLQNVEACALAFKVVTDARRGVLVYVRVYSGQLSRNSLLWNTNLQVTERAQRLMKMYANDAVDVDDIKSGQIGVIPGLKLTRTGDSLISCAGMNPKTGPTPPISQLQLRPIDVPPPVFFVSVEPNSLAEERHVKESLELLLREDPSLSVTHDEESGQTHLAGMGELHLEIARDKLVQDLKAKARIGSVEIGYRETVSADGPECTKIYEREVGGKTSKAGSTAAVMLADEHAAVSPSDRRFELSDNNTLIVSTPTLDADGRPQSPEELGLPASMSLADVLQSLQNGALAALARGPIHGYPMHSTMVRMIFDPSQHCFPTTTLAALSSAARLAVVSGLKESSAIRETAMMEPVMRVAISVDETSLGGVVQDVSSARGGSVISLDASASGDAESTDSAAEDTELNIDVRKIYVPPDPFGSSSSSEEVASGSRAMRTVVARVPLKEMVGYLKHLRSLTGGRGTFTMTVDRFEKMGSQRVKAVLDALRGV